VKNGGLRNCGVREAGLDISQRDYTAKGLEVVWLY
jgi:hypothetical protein